ncbi:MAG TPA: hypothetical protein EYG93_01400 [Sulfurospirillum arcachonense]|nr:hypothetical protein [Sulfurospirillum arcachonense]HIP43976.1 hypothetical protein [Sulfurospirillum arcachonense]
MEELVTTAIKYHQYFIGAMLIIALINLYFIFTCKEFSKKVKKVNPVYYAMLASVAFTGILVLGINSFHMTHAVYLMLVVFLVIFVMSMKLFKKYKYGSPDEYRAFAKKKYILDIVLIVATMGLVYAI